MDDAHEWLPEAGLGPDPATVRDVLAVRPGGLADVVRAVPALRHLRRVYPDASITVAAPAHARELLDACPYVDHVVDDRPAPDDVVRTYDVAVSFAEPGQDCVFTTHRVRARCRAAWRAGEGPTRGTVVPEWPARLPDTLRMLRLTWLLGGEHVDDSLGLWPTLADRNGAAQLVAGHVRPLAVVHAGASRRERRWPGEHWSRVLDLVDAIGLQPVLVGTEVDREITDTAVVEARTAPLVLVERTTVGELAGVLERAALFVGADSGPAALAGALGVRSVVVGPGSPLEHAVRPGQVDLVDAGACVRCGEHACRHVPAPASAVPVEAVLAQVGLAAATALERWNAQQIA